MREPSHRFAVQCQGHAVGVAHEQAAAGAVLQLADVLADGRLLQAEAAAGGGEVAGLRDGQEAFQVNGVEHQSAIQLIAAPWGSVQATGEPLTDSRNCPAGPGPVLAAMPGKTRGDSLAIQ